MNNEIELGVILLPSPQVRDIAIDVSRKLHENFPTDTVLDGKKLHPHITVYQARFPAKSIDRIVAFTKAIVEKVSQFEISLGKFSAWKEFMWWNAEPSNEFDHLSKSVIYQLNPLREGLLLDGLEKGIQNRKFDMSETFSIRNYGSITHPPHLTITHMQSEQDARSAVEALSPRVAKFAAKEMHLGILGKFGTVTEILDTFPFAAQHGPYMF